MRASFAAALLALVLGGCASVAPAPPGALEGARPAANWTLQGRIGVLSSEQNMSGHIRWQHRAESDDLLLTSPLGQGVARIVRDGAGIALELPNQPVRRARDADTLTREALGYELPVAGLAWWVQARPAPGHPFEATRDGAGRLTQLKQDGWTIDYLQYEDAMPARPRKLVVAREGLELRLVADQWTDE